MTRRLSKSRVQQGFQCEKALWLTSNRREVAGPTTESQQWIFDQGHEVGMLARGLFPGGVEISEDHLHSAQALASTRRALKDGARVLYEPAFEFDGVLVRADILVAAGDGRWDMYEVKSGTALKDVYVRDATIQAYVVEGAGLSLRAVSIIRIDTSYVYGGGDYDLNALFAVEDITPMVREFMPRVSPAVARFTAMLKGPEPDVTVGSHCAHPHACEYRAYCHSALPHEFPITDLPRLSAPVLQSLLQAGFTCMLDVPQDFPGLTLAQRQTIAVAQAGEPQVDADGLSRALADVHWPAYHLDFETVSPALPIWPGTRPYQTIPFQYSLHMHYPDGTTKHRQYLHASTGDPRRALARHLIADCGRRGSVIHYTPYERTQIDGLMAALPDMAPSLRFIRKRLLDLEPIIRVNTKHPAAAGRSSIKLVLPAWCPDLSYSGLNISDGQMASARYLRAVKGQVSTAEAEQVLADLREYCALDTYAMVRLLEEMKRLAGGRAENAG